MKLWRDRTFVTDPRTHRCKARKINCCTLQNWRPFQRHTLAHLGPAGWRIERDLLDGTRLCHGSASTSCQLCLCSYRVGGGEWVYRVGQSPHKRARKIEHVNLLDKDEGWRERKRGHGWTLKQSLFSFVQVFSCVHECKRERKDDCVEGEWHRQT